MSSKLSRREFLKVGGAAAAGLLYRDPPGRPIDADDGTAVRLGRTARSLRYYAEPTEASPELGFYNTDAVVDIIKTDRGDPYPEPTNPIWHRTPDGWLHSAYVQPVRRELNQPVFDLSSGPFLAEVTVPYTIAWDFSERKQKQVYRFYYGTTHWVIAAWRDPRDVAWYTVVDDLKKSRTYSVLAEHLRAIPPAELAPISPDVTDKRVELDLTAQRVYAYENGRVVFVAKVATGAGRTETPIGEFRVERKQPSRHMASVVESNGYDLPGVPWVCFIEWTGVSFHGTYWHNNYGRPMSHGCINMTPQAARWLYLWTTPVLAHNDNYEESDDGTRVIIF